MHPATGFEIQHFCSRSSTVRSRSSLKHAVLPITHCHIRTLPLASDQAEARLITEAPVTDSSSVRAEAQELSDSEYLRQLGVEPRFKRALGFLTGSLFAV